MVGDLLTTVEPISSVLERSRLDLCWSFVTVPTPRIFLLGEWGFVVFGVDNDTGKGRVALAVTSSASVFLGLVLNI